ncbi:putative secreted protein (Por secretion system target) [Ulvibacter sp. MAR_2010_11]|uniref:T9SS type A sorting domain-containing protein n=1 Tax=Ulvibacter sp. MAR_2010_11 TaxID=1250229 RepID=UPI000C2C1F1E|nr:T9SS type A sorting domain-containing protein [Ulvibacter sp. MAR_2010_11]PKA83086.1 putative secreted protein (Por secretion system target) [Ulvibacter sp. MAR_2010_11]
MKLINYVQLFLILLLSASGSAQMYDWGGGFGGIGEDVVRAMHVTNDGTTYTTGYFSDTADFDINPAIEYPLTSNGFFDVFVQKTDSGGNLVWATNIGGEFFEYAVGITTDTDGNIYVTGVYEGTVDFDPGIGTTLLTSAGGLDIFVLKLNEDGGFLWARSIGGSDYEETTSIGIAPNGDVIVLGYFYEPVDFDPGAAEYMMSSLGAADSFILRLDENGDFISANRYGGPEMDLGLGMQISNSGDIFITGSFSGTADFDPDDLNEHLVTGVGNFSGYMLHLTASGEFVKAAFTEGGETLSRAITTDTQNNIYLTGYFNGIVNFAPNSGNPDYIFTSDVAYNGFVMKIDGSGDVIWARQIGDENAFFAFDIAVASNGDVFSTGYFDGTVDFDPSTTNEYLLTKESPNAMDAFLVRLSNDGNFIAAFQFGGVDLIDTNCMGIDGSNNVYLSAHFQTVVDINPEAGNSEIITAIDFRDSYLIKMDTEILNNPDAQGASIGFYPNPVQNQLFVTGKESLAGSEFRIFNTMGQLVLSGTLSQNQSIDFHQITKGLYFLKIGNYPSLKIIKD